MLSVSETLIRGRHHGLWSRCHGPTVEHIKVKVVLSVWVVSFFLEMIDDSAAHNGHWHLWSHHNHDRTVLSVVWVSTTGGKRLTTSSEVSWPSVYTAAVAAMNCLSRYIFHVSSAFSFHFLDIPATVSVSSVQPIMGQISSVQSNASSNIGGSCLHGWCDAAQPASASLLCGFGVLSARQEYPECHRVTLRPVRGSTGCAVSHCPRCLPTQLPPGPKNLHSTLPVEGEQRE